MLQKSHTLGGYNMTTNTITQTSTKVDITSRFLGLVDSLPPDEQNLWIPNHVVYDPDTWTTPHLLQLKSEYEILVDKYGCVVKLSWWKTLLFPPQIHSYCLLSTVFISPIHTFRSVLRWGILVRSCHRHSARYRDRS